MFVAEDTSETFVRVEPATAVANVSEKFSINITVTAVQNLYGIEVVLSWNSSVLELADIDVRLGKTDGVLFNDIGIVQNETQGGKYVLAATSIAPAPPFSGNGNIVRVTFRVTNPKESKLNLESQLLDYPPPDREPRISYPIKHTTTNGFFEVIAEFHSLAFLLFMLLAGLAAVVCRRLGKGPTSHSRANRQNLLAER